MLRAENVHKIYKDTKKELHVLRGIDLEVRKDEVMAVVGPSGAGKSTLLHILGGIDSPSSGKVFLDTADFYALDDIKRARFRNEKIGFVFQFYHLLPEFNALENTMLPALIRNQRPKGVPRSPERSEGSKSEGKPPFGFAQDREHRNQKIRDKAEGLLKEVGLGKRMHHRPNELSGGEQQRVAIARALINNPKLLLCDEPTGNLDSKMGDEILRILFELNKKNNMAIIIVTHDKEIAKRSDRVVEMRDGRVV